MRNSFAKNIVAGTAMISLAALLIGATPSFADEVKTNAMSAEPMKTGPMATNAMAADPMKADCTDKAEMEPDAMKKQTMTAECDAMAGGAMKADPMAGDQMAPKQ